jgi:fluoroacetyl-CoA thioesterase
MDLWTAPPGAETDLPTRSGTREGFAALRSAARVVDALAAHLTRIDGTLDALHWYPTDTPYDGAVRLRVRDRSPDGRLVMLRLCTVDGQPLADVRLRRTGSVDPAPLVAPVPGRGDVITRRFEVAASMLTDHIPGREPVLTTPDLIAFLEDTAADLLRPRFAPGVSSVGTWIGIRHTAPAWLGEHVDVTAEVLQVRGRRFTFDVRACVGDREIGVGQVGQTLIRA